MKLIINYEIAKAVPMEILKLYQVQGKILYFCSIVLWFIIILSGRVTGQGV